MGARSELGAKAHSVRVACDPCSLGRKPAGRASLVHAPVGMSGNDRTTESFQRMQVCKRYVTRAVYVRNFRRGVK
jgi:hypothetical protein